MNIFPITSGDFDDGDALNEILGFQVVDSRGIVIAKGETEKEAEEKALMTMFLKECNEIASKKITLHPKLLNKKVAQKC